eukprot:3049157-Amphidinium_carterae.1
MMRSVDSLKGQTEYNMDTVTGNLFAKLKSSSVHEKEDLCWFTNQRPYELYVASGADFREVMRRYPAHKLSLVSFWT